MHVRNMLGAIVASALLFTLAEVPAYAESYAPDPVSQDFAGSAGGWTQSSTYSQLCVQTLVCPSVANTYNAGGADGNGYIRTQFATFVETVPGTSTGIWESPAFTYILPSSAKVQGHLLVLQLRCPAIASPKPCQIQFAGLQGGRFTKAATARKVVKIKAGKTRTVKIRIKPKYVATYQAASKIWTKSIVRVGKVRVTVRKRMKV